MKENPIPVFGGNGGRYQLAIKGIDNLVAGSSNRLSAQNTKRGCLESGITAVSANLGMLANREKQRIACLLITIFAASHVKSYLVSEISNFALDHPDIDMLFG